MKMPDGRRRTKFRFNQELNQHEVKCVRCLKWRPFNEVHWPRDPNAPRDRLQCKHCYNKTLPKPRPPRYFDKRIGWRVNRQRCKTCFVPKPTTSFGLIPGTKLTQERCRSCTRKGRTVPEL